MVTISNLLDKTAKQINGISPPRCAAVGSLSDASWLVDFVQKPPAAPAPPLRGYSTGETMLSVEKPKCIIVHDMVSE